MIEVLAIVAPAFALIAIGYVAGRTGYVGEAMGKAVADFTFKLAIPALLFRTMATTPLPDVAPVALWTSYFGSGLAVWLAAAAATRLLLRRPAVDGAAISFSAAYGNIVMLGIPLATSAFGPEAMAYLALILSLHSPLVWLGATVHMGIAEGSARTGALGIVHRLVMELATNPILLAIMAGTAWRLSGLALPGVCDRTIALLGQAGVPSALVAIGLSLVRFQIAGEARTLVTLLVLKNIAMPLLAWLLAARVLALPPTAVGVVVLLAAMPTGANAYLFASRYGAAVQSTSGAIALGTILAAPVVASVLYIVRPG